jgi:thymidine phosphorylase
VNKARSRPHADLVKLILDFAEKLSTTSRSKLEARLKDGSAWEKVVSLVYAQDGDATALEQITEIPHVLVILPLFENEGVS